MPESTFPIPNPNGERIDPQTGLPLPDPFPDYVTCPNCGQAEVEVWCNQEGGACHQCGEWVQYARPLFCGIFPYCKNGIPPDEAVP